MTEIRAEPDGRVVVESPRYRLDVTRDGMRAMLTSPGGDLWATLRPFAAVDRVDVPDETLELSPPRVVDGAIEVARRSTAWEEAWLRLVCTDETLELRASVRGRGELADVHLLGGRSLISNAVTGFLPSGSAFRSVFTPNPGDPNRLVRPAAEPAVIGVSGDSEFGRGHWFFTPAPLYLALTPAAGITDPDAAPDGGWVGLAIAAPVDELQFLQLRYEPSDLAFSLRLEYEGHTRVDGTFTTPTLVLTPGERDAYAGLRRHRALLAERGAAPAPDARTTPAWWSEPIFCGWGAQCHLARDTHHLARDLATQANYDTFLGHLEGEGVVPGIVVLDDKWQLTYGRNEPDPRKWPDLRAWIARRHERGQHVLLWWKAWAAEGLPAELCIRTGDGTPVAPDPTNPEAREALRASVLRMLSPEGLDGDGLKIDFTARTPSGRALATHGRGWGIALLHELLGVVYAAAKEAKPDALVMTHTPHPAFADVTDMLRLNDMIRMDDPGRPPLDDLGAVPPVTRQMRFRADVARAACPELLIDTDDWCVPSRAAWRDYVEAKIELGIPSLYYATHFDATGEPLEPGDYAALRRTWQRWRSGVAR